MYCKVVYCTAVKDGTKLYSFVLYCIVVYCKVVYCTVVYCILLYCTVLYSILLYCLVFHCIAYYYTELFSISLYCIVLYCTSAVLLESRIVWKVEDRIPFILNNLNISKVLSFFTLLKCFFLNFLHIHIQTKKKLSPSLFRIVLFSFYHFYFSFR